MEKDFACPHCGTINDINRGLYCTSCGKLLMNSCTNDDCRNIDIISADIMCDDRYCPLCGTDTVFYVNGWITD